MNHPDFRISGKILATLKHDELTAMVKLTPDQQREFVEEDPETFAPESGAWGRMGCTRVVLASANEDTLGRALTLARQNILNDAASRKTRRPAARRRQGRQ